MTGIEQKIALETFKPTTGFISALLEPKIKQVKQWSEERELHGKLEPENLAKVVGTYLHKISHRVSTITTIAFPLQKLNITEAYEPLFIELFNKGKNVGKYTVESILESDKKSSLIIDSAGMGKSTFSKYLITQVLFKSSRIPIFLELRKVNKETGLIESLASELDMIGHPFSRDLFSLLTKLGKFIIILDGFDEVAVDLQYELSNQIYDLSFKGGENILLLTSRPQEAIPELVNGNTYKFSQFTKDQAESLVTRYDSISGLDVGARLIKEIDCVPTRFIETPLLVSLLYRTFGTNNSIADRICTFYDEIYQALYKGHDLMNKNGYTREKKSKLDFEDFRRLLRALCYYMSISRKTSFETYSEAISYIDKAVEISSVKPTSSSMFLDDLLVAVPLMQKDGCEYKFLHKTILEFFSAEYIIYRNDSLTLAKKIFNSKLCSSFEKIFDFIYDISPSLFENSIIKYHAEKILSIKCGDNINERVINTLIYLKGCKVGLWEKSKYSRESGDCLFFDTSSTLSDFEEGYFRVNWRSATVNGIDYYLAFKFTDIRSNFHKQAWHQLSEEINIDRTKVNCDLAVVHQSLSINEWVTLTSDLACKLSKSDEFTLEAANAIVHNRVNVEDFEPRVLSLNKAKEIINRLNRENEIDSEFNSFLS